MTRPAAASWSGWLLGPGLKGLRLPALALLIAVLLWALLLGTAGSWLHGLEERSGDLAWRLLARDAAERRLVVVDIDERSLREVGPWPWSHDTQARLIEQLAKAGVRQQIIDIVFTEARGDLTALLQVVQRQRPVLSQVFALEQGGSPSAGSPSGALDWPTCPAPFGAASGHLANFEALQAAGSRPLGYTGHITPRIAADGVLRHQPAIICEAGRSYPALAIAALMRGSGETSLTLQRGHSWLAAPWTLAGANQALARIPLDERGDLRIAWHLQPDSFISLSAADVLAGRVPSGLLDGTWVLLGSSAFGLNDSVATPFGGAVAGLQTHAQLITALLDGRIPATPRASPLLQGLAALLGVALLGWLARPLPQPPAPTPEIGSATHGQRARLPVVLLPLAALGLALLLALLHGLLLFAADWWIGWLAPALLVLLTGTLMGMLAHAQSRLDRNRLFGHLSSYLPAPVAASLALQPPSSAIKASSQQVSVLFADIRNFSAYCEARPPDEAAAVLHAFFSTATRVVESQGGVIEAFQGDAIFAVWNGQPHAGSAHATGHAEAALRAAVQLLAAVRDVLPDPAPAGLEPLSLGIGVETGPAVAGSFGLASRRTHLVMGRTVTIASRLVDMTCDLSHPILVGEGLAGQLGGVGLESMGTFLLDGMRTPHHVYAYPLADAPRLD